MVRAYTRKSEPSTQAADNPVMAAPKEQEFDHSAMHQRGVIDLDNPAESIAIVDKMPEAEYADLLKFAEDPVTGVISPSSDRNAPKYVYCGVNGTGAEVWDERTKRWLRFPYVPVGRVLTMKRKYWEVLGRSRTETFRTREVTPTPHANQDGFVLEAETVAVAPFNVRHDPAGAKGHEWYQRVIAEF